MSGGSASIAGLGEGWYVKKTSAASPTGDKVSIYLTDSLDGQQTLVGAGDTSGIVPSYCMTFGTKVYLLAGSTVFFSESTDPKSFNNVDGTGNGYVSLSDQYQSNENLLAMAPFQGKLAFFGRQTTQVWTIASEPANWAIDQLLPNVGTIAKESVKPKGDIDVLFLSDTGVRNLQARVSTLNAFVDDIGSPIDSLIQAQLITTAPATGVVDYSAGSGGTLAKASYYYTVTAVVGGVEQVGAETVALEVVNSSATVNATGKITLSWAAVSGATSYKVYRTTVPGFYPNSSLVGTTASTTLIDTGLTATAGTPPSGPAQACAVVEPSSSRYWLFLRDTIYVLSYFLSSKVMAWSTYEPKDSSGSSFTPKKFLVFRGQVYAWTGNTIYRYGGADNNTYDSTTVTVELPWLDLKSPDSMKKAIAVNAAYTGNWSISIGMDPVSGTYEPVAWSGTSHTYDKGRAPMSGHGSHFKGKLTTSGTGAAVFSSLVFHYDYEEQV